MTGNVLVLVALGLVPFALLSSTSFMKLSIVFSILRNALGTGQIPSGMVITVLSALLTGYVMAPVATDMAARTSADLAQVDWDDPLGGASRPALLRALGAGQEPLRAFLQKNAGQPEVDFFAGLARRGRDAAAVGATDLRVVLPAFFLTELSEALQIGFLVLLPFIVVDLVVAVILAALGMQALQAQSVALPLKLLLLVSSDGLRTLIDALVAGYR